MTFKLKKEIDEQPSESEGFAKRARRIRFKSKNVQLPTWRWHLSSWHVLLIAVVGLPIYLALLGYFDGTELTYTPETIETLVQEQQAAFAGASFVVFHYLAVFIPYTLLKRRHSFPMPQGRYM